MPTEELITIPADPGAPPKPGYKTTEFYTALSGIILILLDVIPAPQSKEGLYATLIVVAYALARGLAKIGPNGADRDAFTTIPPEARVP